MKASLPIWQKRTIALTNSVDDVNPGLEIACSMQIIRFHGHMGDLE
jgi:hypothetical protein